MKFLEPKTFREAMLPVTLMRRALGLGTFEYPIGRPRRAISLCWSGICLILFFYSVKLAGLRNMWENLHLKESTFSNNSHVIGIVSLIICGITLVCVGQVRSKNLMEFLDKIEGVNNMLNKLGVPKEYGLIFKYQMIHLIVAFLFMLVLTVSPFWINITHGSGVLMGTVISVQYVTLISFLEDYTFSYCVRYIGTRFQHLNTYLVKLSIEDGNATPLFQDLRDHTSRIVPTALGTHPRFRRNQQSIMCSLRDAMKIHHDLCSLAKNLNETFGVQILISMSLCIFFITFILFNAYNPFMRLTEVRTEIVIRILTDLSYIGFYALRIFYLIYTCSITSSEAQQTKKDIYDLINPTTSNEVKDEIYAFSLRLMQNPLRFTACGLFTLDPMVIHAIVGTVTTYLVIMIQMGKSPDRVNNIATNATIPAWNTTV